MIDINWLTLAPPLALLVTACIGIVFGIGFRSTRPTALLSLVGVGVAFLFTVLLLGRSGAGETLSSFGLRYLADQAALTFNVVILLGTALTLFMSYTYLGRARLEHAEFYPLVLLSATGAMVMAAAGDFITLLLGLEILSLAVYVLSAWRQGVRESEEAGMKYFLLGAFASAFLIYGIALMYGATGHFTYAGVVALLSAEGFDQPLLAALGGVFILAGLAFKAAFAPFHQWAPDVYTGAPTPVTAFMSVVVKAAAFAALLRVFATVFPALGAVVPVIFAVLVGLTMVIGNLSALVQRSVKRMLAYSAVAHAGYLGLAVLAAGQGANSGAQAVVWYLLAYTLMNAGALAVMTLITDPNDHGDDLERLAGLGRTRPYLAALMAVFMLSLAGIPPLAGFVGKVLVFQAAIQAGYLELAVLGIVTSIVAVVYYFRVVGAMYFREAEYEPQRARSQMTNVALGVAALGTVLLGLLPGWWYGWLSVGGPLLAGF
ncbi:NADH-quinone oxidoreductase subunit N [Truepera radiovictrix]|uniref:NADH-quinone oxidoreductase subunit N n=1 Tax=Truepera radiovictrix (strain DSM 17093 / CIP 108686 / LMG 22925 / RQ-24) TaxID=649638 RepID=D7CWB8_TRURR|nr:NADH-quinone oxidoreductase subunit N [Truepera radiovictrix]ADI16068.1 proton-translocating NADH-quinone oxidoreductase, chain N [Truepera radiovictrix DSM 17093]WMT58305.1 NADH-quinone oxidoreductase subunit N [Truepera radiovictrix]